MIRSDDPEVEGHEFRYKVIEVNGVMGDTVFKGTDTREFRTIEGAERYAEKLMRRGRGQPVIIQTGKLLWLTQVGKEAEIERIKAMSPDAGLTPECPTCGRETEFVSGGTPCYQCHFCQQLWPAAFFDDEGGTGE